MWLLYLRMKARCCMLNVFEDFKAFATVPFEQFLGHLDHLLTWSGRWIWSTWYLLGLLVLLRCSCRSCCSCCCRCCFGRRCTLKSFNFQSSWCSCACRRLIPKSCLVWRCRLLIFTVVAWLLFRFSHINVSPTTTHYLRNGKTGTTFWIGALGLELGWHWTALASCGCCRCCGRCQSRGKLLHLLGRRCAWRCSGMGWLERGRLKIGGSKRLSLKRDHRDLRMANSSETTSLTLTVTSSGYVSDDQI